MATFYASTAGSNTAPYDTWAKAATSIQTAINALATSGDEVVIDDEAWVLTSALTNTGVSLAGNGSFVVRSRSDDPSMCSIDANGASRQCIFFNEATQVYDFDFQGIKFTNSVQFTQAGGGACYRSQNTQGDIAFTNCDINTFDLNIDAAGFGPLIRSTTPTATLTLDNTKVRNITSVCTTGTADGVIRSVGPFVMINGSDITSCTKNQNANNEPSLGFINANAGISVDEISVDNIILTCPDASTGAHPAMFNSTSLTEASTFKNVRCLDSDSSGVTLTKTGGGNAGGLVLFNGPFVVENVTMEKATVSEEVVNGWGCCIGATGVAATGTIDGLTVSNCTAQHGAGVYLSEASSATMNRLDIHDNTVVGRAGIEPGAGGAIYIGGYDTTNNIYYSNLYNNTADEGGAIYAHQKSAGSTQPRTTNIFNVVMYGNTGTGGDSGEPVDGGFFRGNLTHPHTVNVTNCISWNGGTLEMQATADASVVFNVDHCDVQGGAAAVVGEDNYTNNINADPLFLNTTGFKLKPGSPCFKTGVDVSLVSDFYNIGVSDPPNMGISEGVSTGRSGGGGGSLSLGFGLRL